MTTEKTQQNFIGLENNELVDTLNSLADAFLIIEKNGVVRFANKAAEQLFNLLLQKVQGKKIEECLSKEHYSLLSKYLSKNQKEENNISINEEYFAEKDLWYSVEVRQSAKFYYIFFHDITLHKKTEASLKASEEKFRILIEQAVDGIFHGDTEGNFIGVNTKGVELTGYTKEELLTMNMGQLFSEAEKQRAPLRYDLLKQGLDVINERELTRKDGSTRFVEMHTKMLPDKTYQSIFRDITERKKAEEKLRASEALYRTVFENTGTAMVLINEDTTLELVNSKFEELSGYTKAEIENKMSWTNFVVKEDLEEMKKRHDQRRENPDNVPKTYEFRFIDKNKKVKYILLTVDLIPGTRKSTASLIDITERKLNEDRLNSFNQKLEILINERNNELIFTNKKLQNEILEREKAEKYIKKQLNERDVLLKEIHHRVKNNLQIIVSILNLQLYNEKNEKVCETIRDSQNRIKTMALIHEKLYQSKNFSRISIREYLNNLLNFLFLSYKTEAQTVNYKVETDCLELSIDTSIALGLITNELVSNAFKYAFAEKNKCEIELKLKKYKKNQLLYSLYDNGKGLPPKFDLAKTESLGLQLVSLLTEQIDGTLSVETSNNKGTKFQIIFSANQTSNE